MKYLLLLLNIAAVLTGITFWTLLTGRWVLCAAAQVVTWAFIWAAIQRWNKVRNDRFPGSD